MRVIEVRRMSLPGQVSIATVAVQGESKEEELARRPFRPVHAMKQAVVDGLFDEGLVPASITWDPLLGCPCGCRPAFVLGGLRALSFLMLLDPEFDEMFLAEHRGEVNRRRWAFLQLTGSEHPIG
jgi:hypothetical protein